MKQGKSYTLDMRRKREGKTDYRLRRRLLASRQPRVAVRKSLNNLLIQIIKFENTGDKVLVSANTRELVNYGWKGHRGNISSAYLAGLLCGFKALKKGIKSGILDLGLYTAVKNSVFFAVVKGLKETGLHIPVDEDVIPDKERLYGKHIESYANMIKSRSTYQKVFSKYLKQGLKPEEISKHIEEIKNKIIQKWQP